MAVRGLGRVYRRGQVYWIQYSHRGQTWRESSGSNVRGDAARLLKRRLGETGKGRPIGADAERTMFEDLAKMLFDDYRVNGRKSLARAEQSVEHLRRYFGRCHAMDITTDRVSAYIRCRLEETERPAKPATVRNELAALGRMFTLGVRAGRVTTRPYFPSVEVRNTRSGFFEESDLRAVLVHLPAHLRPAIEFAYLTGWRIGEVKSLTWRQVDFLGGMVRLEPGTTKNEDGRAFPFRALPSLAHLLNGQRDHTSALERETGQIVPWVFHRRGRPLRDFRDAWARACALACVPGRLVHDLRRTAVRNLERAGVPRSVAMKLSGHRTESIFRRYAIVAEMDLIEGVQKLAALSSSGGIAGHSGTARRTVSEGSSTVVAQFGTSGFGVAADEGSNPLPDNLPGAGLEPARAFAQRILSSSEGAGVQDASEQRTAESASSPAVEETDSDR